jgi:putative flippase GtrA
MSHKTHTLKSRARHIWKYEKIRFALVGAINTLVDFIIFLTLAKMIGLPAVAANVISTSCALAVSYLLNKKAVFGDTNSNNRQQVTQFIVVTLSGLWVLQAIVITMMASLLNDIVPQLPSVVVLIMAKAVATVFSLTWNYLWYSRVVFRKARA